MINFVPKNWGFEKWIDNNELYCGKLLFVVKEKKGSLHFHKLKTETFYLHSGKVLIKYFDDLKILEKRLNAFGERGLDDFLEKMYMSPGDTLKIPAGRVHQIIGLEDSELFEFSTQHFDNDSYRLVKGD